MQGTYVQWDEDENGDAVDVLTYCTIHAPADARRWPCYADQLNAGEVAYCATCARPVAWSAERCGGVSTESGSAAVLTVGVLALVIVPALVFVRSTLELIGGALS